jgi:hypothetical protein
VLDLSARLTIGVAPWRDPEKVATAVRGWAESSLASAREEGHAVLVALLDGQVAGMVSLAERKHFTGDLDAYVGELVIDLQERTHPRVRECAASCASCYWRSPLPVLCPDWAGQSSGITSPRIESA